MLCLDFTSESSWEDQRVDSIHTSHYDPWGKHAGSMWKNTQKIFFHLLTNLSTWQMSEFLWSWWVSTQRPWLPVSTCDWCTLKKVPINSPLKSFFKPLKEMCQCCDRATLVSELVCEIKCCFLMSVCQNADVYLHKSCRFVPALRILSLYVMRQQSELRRVCRMWWNISSVWFVSHFCCFTLLVQLTSTPHAYL